MIFGSVFYSGPANSWRDGITLFLECLMLHASNCFGPSVRFLIKRIISCFGVKLFRKHVYIRLAWVRQRLFQDWGENALGNDHHTLMLKWNDRAWITRMEVRIDDEALFHFFTGIHNGNATPMMLHEKISGRTDSLLFR